MLESLYVFPFVCSKRDQNIGIGYTLEVTGTHNHCFKTDTRNKVYPSKSQFNNIKVEFDGGLNYTGVLASYSTTKVPKFSDARELCCKLPKIQTKMPKLKILCQKDTNGIANNEDPDQIAPLGAV